MQAQSWICPECHDDKHHVPGDHQCEANKEQAKALAERDELRARIAMLEEALCQCAVIAKANGTLDKPLHELITGSIGDGSDLWLSQQKAEAVMAFAARIEEKWSFSGTARVRIEAKEYAEELVQIAMENPS